MHNQILIDVPFVINWVPKKNRDPCKIGHNSSKIHKSSRLLKVLYNINTKLVYWFLFSMMIL